jgi:hypothetical protein
VKAGDSSDTMASFYHEMLGSGWQKWDLGPGPATELEKLIPAQKAGGVVARPPPKADFPTVRDTWLNGEMGIGKLGLPYNPQFRLY